MSANPQVQRIGDGFAFLLKLLRYCRVSVLVIVAGGALLFLTDQGNELTISLAREPIKQVFFVIAVTVWAWVSWYWSRRILLARAPVLKKALRRMAEDRGEDADKDGLLSFGNWTFANTPRLIGLVGFAVAVGSSLLNGLVYTVLACGALGAVSYAYWTRRWHESVGQYADLMEADAAAAARSRYARPISHVLNASILLLFAPWAIWGPVSMGFTLGAATVVFLGLAGIAVVGNFIVLKTHKIGFPVVTVLLILAGLFSGLGWNDNHRIRVAEDEAGNPVPVEDRKSLAKALNDWKPAQDVDEARRSTATWWMSEEKKVPSNKRPLVLVATAGGGLRAAYWTVTVLGAVQDAAPEFRDALFAISGVSGGSLGATVFNAVLVQGTPTCPARWRSRNGEERQTRTCFEATAQAVLSRDFLGPTAAAMMYPDLVQKVVAPAFLPSRATALETSWEGSWDRIYPDSPGRLAEPFLKLWASAEPDWLPALFLNGTHQESGKRIIASNLRVTPDIFIDAADIYSKIDGNGSEPVFLYGDMPASTAAHNSARFSYVSPAGTLKTGGHVIDGGYFENYGAHTINELVESIDERLSAVDSDYGGKRPIVIIQISNDTDLADRLTVKGPAGSDKAATVFPPDSTKDPTEYLRSAGIRKASSTFNEVTAPVVGLLNTRTARGVLAAKTMGDWARWLQDQRDRPSMYLHFRLFKAKDESLALGWILSSDSESSMRKQLRSGTNLVNFAKLLCALGSDPSSLAERLPPLPNDLNPSGACEDLGKP